jgi:phosphatidylglycerol:prolipoprotein diacylglycerol transferase
MWPILFTIPMPFGWGPLRIPAFGFMVVTAFLVSTGWMRRLAKREGIPPEKLEPMFMIVLVGIVAGGRLFYVLTNLGEFEGRWLDAIRIDKGGMVMYGGLIAVVVGAFLYLRRAKLPPWTLADIGAVCGALAIGIGRIGCILAGCDYGKPVDPDFPLAVRFPTHAESGSFFGLTVPPLPSNAARLAGEGWRHPTQVYQCLAGLATAAFLYWLLRHRRFPGQVLAAFLFLKASYRFGLEYLRGDEGRGWIGPFSQAQFIGLIMAAVAVFLWIVLSRRAPKPAGQAT